MVVEIGPGLQIVAGLGIGIAAAQQRAQMILDDVVLAVQEHLIRLGHLPDLLVQRQGGEQLAGLGIESRKPPAWRRSAVRRYRGQGCRNKLAP